MFDSAFDAYDGKFPEPVRGAQSYYGQSELEQRALYGVTRLNLSDDLELILGARDNSHRKAGDAGGTSSRVSDSEVTPYAGIIYDLTDNLSAQLNANNVTDEKYFDIFDAYGAMTYGAPRSVTASAKYRF